MKLINFILQQLERCPPDLFLNYTQRDQINDFDPLINYFDDDVEIDDFLLVPPPAPIWGNYLKKNLRI